jgi:hypothetical protein
VQQRTCSIIIRGGPILEPILGIGTDIGGIGLFSKPIFEPVPQKKQF